MADVTGFKEVAAIFSQHCARCHNELDREGDFSLEAEQSLDESGFVIARDPASHVLAVIQPDGDEPPAMPKDADPLSEEPVAAIKRWIEAGAAWLPEARIEPAVSDFDWWSFRPIKRAAVPDMDSVWVQTPVDAFVLAKLSEKGLRPVGRADRRALVRRITHHDQDH